jgi:hypothetical protein
VPLGVRAAERSWVVARLTGVCPAEPPSASSGRASSPWSTRPGRRPWRRSPVGVHHAVSIHPGSSSGIRRWPSGVQPSGVRSPGVVVQGPGSGRLLSTRPAVLASTRPASSRLVSSPSGIQPIWCPARLVSAPSVRTPLSPPIPGGGAGTRSRQSAPPPQDQVEVPVGCRAVERLGRWPRGPDAGGAAASRVGHRGSVADPGRVGEGGDA